MTEPSILIQPSSERDKYLSPVDFGIALGIVSYGDVGSSVWVKPDQVRRAADTVRR